MTPADGLLLVGTGFGAGAVNAVAGGGSLISFPALLGVGLPILPANVTNTVALWPGYVGGALGYRRELRSMHRLLNVIAISVLGAVAGAVLLLNTPTAWFSHLVPWLILLGTGLFAVQPVVARRLLATRSAAAARAGDVRDGSETGWPIRFAILLASVYGAYFGAGLGVMLLAILGVFMPGELQDSNALKNSLSLSINTVALIAFALFGPVHWVAVLIMAVACLAGGYFGAMFARRLPPIIMRTFIIIFGLVVSIKLFWSQ